MNVPIFGCVESVSEPESVQHGCVYHPQILLMPAHYVTIDVRTVNVVEDTMLYSLTHMKTTLVTAAVRPCLIVADAIVIGTTWLTLYKRGGSRLISANSRRETFANVLLTDGEQYDIPSESH